MYLAQLQARRNANTPNFNRPTSVRRNQSANAKLARLGKGLSQDLDNYDADILVHTDGTAYRVQANGWRKVS